MSAEKRIPLAAPTMKGNEKTYVLDCLESNWISSAGGYVSRFESAFGDFCGTRFAVASCNGTAALHLGLLALGVGPGDDVIVPTLTFVASANAVSYCGATPVFVDSEPGTWNLDSAKLEELITPRTKAIMAVHLYGQPAEMDSILSLAEARNLSVIEDSAQAHGARYHGRTTGSIGDVASFSLYGNKVLTSGEGGVVTTQDEEIDLRARLFRGQGMDITRRYWFPVIGYNYRMTNLTAAIGLGQVESAADHLSRRSEIYDWYRECLANEPRVRWQRALPGSTPSHWLVTVVLDGDEEIERDTVMSRLMDKGIETRPVFYPMHTLPPYRSGTSRAFPVADEISQKGISLPTWEGLTRNDVDRVCDELRTAIG